MERVDSELFFFGGWLDLANHYPKHLKPEDYNVVLIRNWYLKLFKKNMYEPLLCFKCGQQSHTLAVFGVQAMLAETSILMTMTFGSTVASGIATTIGELELVGTMASRITQYMIWTETGTATTMTMTACGTGGGCTMEFSIDNYHWKCTFFPLFFVTLFSADLIRIESSVDRMIVFGSQWQLSFLERKAITLLWTRVSFSLFFSSV